MTKYIYNYWHYILLSLLILIYIITFSTFSILRHEAYASNFDLANMSQTVWNTLYGNFFSLTGVEGTISRFSIHADLILVLLAPFYLIWESSRMLLVLQSIGLGLAAIPVYFLSTKVFSKSKSISELQIKIISLILVVVFLLNPGMQWTNIYDFHGVALAIPFLLSAFYFAYIKNWKWFWLFAILALTTKEQIGFSLAMYGVVIALVFKNMRVGISAFFIGIVWSLLMIFIVIPYFSPVGSHWALEWFQFESPGTNETSIIPSYQNLIDKFYNFNSVPYYNLLLKPFAYLPLLGLPWLLLSLPDLTINVLSRQAQMQSIYFHYDSGVTPGLIIATIFGIYYFYLFILKIKLIKKYANTFLLLFVIGLLIVAFRVNYNYSPLPTTPSCWCLMYQVGDDERRFSQLLRTIPKNASVAASGEIRAHLAKRVNAYTLPHGTDRADYVAILDETRVVGDYTEKEFEINLMKNEDFIRDYELIDNFGHFYLYKRK